MFELLFDVVGCRYLFVMLFEFYVGCLLCNKGICYFVDLFMIEEIVIVMCYVGDSVYGCWVCGLIVVLWCVGLCICEVFVFVEVDLDLCCGLLLVWCGKGGRCCEVGMDDWVWEQFEFWLWVCVELFVGLLFCVVNGVMCGWLWVVVVVCLELWCVVYEVGVC